MNSWAKQFDIGIQPQLADDGSSLLLAKDIALPQWKYCVQVRKQNIKKLP
jgi:hypothetical protein